MKGRILGIALAATAACVGTKGDREVRLERLAGEHRALQAQLEDLQARLIVDRERVRFWEEMRDRHASVSAIACTSQDAHAAAMALSLEEEREREAALVGRRRGGARVAAVRAERATALRP